MSRPGGPCALRQRGRKQIAPQWPTDLLHSPFVRVPDEVVVPVSPLSYPASLLPAHLGVRRAKFSAVSLLQQHVVPVERHDEKLLLL